MKVSEQMRRLFTCHHSSHSQLFKQQVSTSQIHVTTIRSRHTCSTGSDLVNPVCAKVSWKVHCRLSDRFLHHVFTFVVPLQFAYVRRRPLFVHQRTTLLEQGRQGCRDRPVLTHACQSSFARECMVDSVVKRLRALRFRVIPAFEECTGSTRVALTSQPRHRRHDEVSIRQHVLGRFGARNPHRPIAWPTTAQHHLLQFVTRHLRESRCLHRFAVMQNPG